MNLKTYFMLLPQFLILFPAALLCYLPVKGQLKFPPVRTAVLCLGIWIPYAALAALLCLVTRLDVNLVLFPSLLLFFLFYRHTVCSGLSCILSIFVGVCTLMTFPSHFAYALDAWLYPASGSASFSMWAALFQLGLSCLLTAALAVPCSKYYSRMVRQLSFPQVWYPLLIVQSIFFLFNILMIPHSYKTLYTGRVFSMFLALEIIMFVLFLLIQIIFYHLADTLLEHTRLMERSRILEMEADQYRTLQNYMQQTRRLRHDFRQSVHILSALAEAGNLPDLKAHLQEYEQRWSIETPVNYCSNASLNALFNYYKGMADSEGVDTNWQLRIPEPLTISELDLVSLFGNLMENAIAGCRTLPQGQRRFALSVEVHQENCMYIVSTNSFDGHTRKAHDAYLSTKHGRDGIGLFSITAIAEKYCGSARFTHSGQEFFADVMLKI